MAKGACHPPLGPEFDPRNANGGRMGLQLLFSAAKDTSACTQAAREANK